MRTRWIVGCVAWCLVSAARAHAGEPATAAPVAGTPAITPPGAVAPVTPPGAVAPVTPPGVVVPVASGAATAPGFVEQTEIESYRLPLVAIDATSMALVVIGFASENPRTTTVGVVGFGLAGPIFHAAHHHPIRAGLSVALRVGLPLAGMLLGARQGRTSYYNCDFDNICDRSSEDAGRGLLLGILGAAIIDDAIIAEPVRIDRRVRTTWAPQVTAASHQASLGIVGSF